VLDGWTIVIVAFAYVSLLFVVAWIGDGFIRTRKHGGGRPLTYSLSLAVYCTSWTFFGSVGLSAATGYDFLPVYLGPIIVFFFGWRFLQRITRLAKSQNITSVADFLAARYGKSPAVAALVTLIAVAGTLPYIALQLKAAAVSVETLIGRGSLESLLNSADGIVDTALVVAACMALFAVLFGTRHIEATEHQEGLMLAIAAESVVKLMAFLTVGIFVVFWLFDGPRDLAALVSESPGVEAIFTMGFNGGAWLTITFLSLVCIVLLPRQFHVTVVENNSDREIQRARWLFPLYLVAINIFVAPIAAAGLLTVPRSISEPDMFVLALPMAAHAQSITLIAFLGGLSAATAMVIVDSVALAIMVCNGLVMPLLVKRRGKLSGQKDDGGELSDMTSTLLAIRRLSIVAILGLGYLFYRALGQVHGLATIGLLSFAAIAQLAPAFIGGLFWRKGTALGAISGIVAGFALWFYALMVPWIIRAGFLPASILTDGPFGLGFLKPQTLFYLQFEPLTHGVIWSLGANILAYITMSLLRAPMPIERLQAHLFIVEDAPRPAATPSFRLWRTTITNEDLQRTAARYLGAERAERSFQDYASSRAIMLRSFAEADIATIRFTEHLLTSAIGAASARLVLSLLLRRSDAGSQSALRLLDDATEALQYNRDLLQSAIDQVRHGLSVFDKDLRLVFWNRRFREMLDVPTDLGRVGVPLDRILRTCAERGDFGPGEVNALVADRLSKLTVTRETFQERFDDGRRIIEVRTAPMPQGGFVSTFSDITERMQAAAELAKANESLERRVLERTNELLEANQALAVAKMQADEANLDKTRFIAAASHDILQPLNAARLYATSLIERPLEPTDASIAHNIDAALQSVEEIFSALIEISRLDAGRQAPEISDFALGELLDQLELEFAPQAREKGLELRFVRTQAWVSSDRRLLRRILQNLVSNAIKYTPAGKVLVGTRRKGGRLSIGVYDTGLGIRPSDQTLIFKEFQRLDGAAATERGIGLGLSIVERICRMLDYEVAIRSEVGRGSHFSIALPRAEPRIVTLPRARGRVRPSSISGRVCLCIDNERQVLDGMETLLTGWDCIVLTARNTEEALAAIEESSVVPDIVLADFHLDSETGIAAIGALRRRYGRDLPAVIITADRTHELRREAAAIGAVVLNKPLKVASLRAVISQFASRRAPAAE